jgi:broad specificity phosphatase PhoE
MWQKSGRFTRNSIFLHALTFRDSAGTTDSALTNHGMLQIESLGQHFASSQTRVNTVFASDLSRARITAEGICRFQTPLPNQPRISPILTDSLRERHYGKMEGKKWIPSGSIEDSGIESDRSMIQRANNFLNEHLLPLILDDPQSADNVVIIAHGILLRRLWTCLMELVHPADVHTAPEKQFDLAVVAKPAWSNTGVTTVLLRQSRVADSRQPHTLLHGWSITILDIDNKDHLANVSRTRGGIGSAAHDAKQKTVDRFFKRKNSP